MLRVALAQLNQTVGDLDGNVERLRRALKEADQAGAQLVAAPELAVTGYPPEDLVFKPSFVAANRAALEEVAGATGDAVAVIGFVDRSGDTLYNAAAVCRQGRVLAIYHKHLLPNYGVFDERRYFRPGRGHTLLDTPAGVIGVSICEDAWEPDGPVVAQGDAGAQVVININASPFHKGKADERIDMLAERARRAGAAIVYVNMVGGQDELVFDGASLVLGPGGELVARLPSFEEQVAVVDVPVGSPGGRRHPSVRHLRVDLPEARGPAPVPPHADIPEPAAEIYGALVTGLRDYVIKNGFHEVVVGLSGGIDSSLTATVAADALGPDAVLGVLMPSPFSTEHSLSDARRLAAELGIRNALIRIDGIYEAYLDALRGAFGPHPEGVAEENIQARIRGNLLMAVSNRWGHLLVATGNKSEMACGYATLYGDMAGGYALLKDVFKTEVYALARWRNAQTPAIPDNVLTKAPSAELRPDQKDEDSLPPYPLLDGILERYIERDLDIDAIVGDGYDRDTVRRVIELVDRAEYKRRQAPPGPKVTTKAFGRDRRLPITNAWRGGPGGRGLVESPDQG